MRGTLFRRSREEYGFDWEGGPVPAKCPAPGCENPTEAEACMAHWLEVPQKLRVNVRMLQKAVELPGRRQALVEQMQAQGLW